MAKPGIQPPQQGTQGPQKRGYGNHLSSKLEKFGGFFHKGEVLMGSLVVTNNTRGISFTKGLEIWFKEYLSVKESLPCKASQIEFVGLFGQNQAKGSDKWQSQGFGLPDRVLKAHRSGYYSNHFSSKLEKFCGFFHRGEVLIGSLVVPYNIRGTKT
jgi:hypothetical protein